MKLPHADVVKWLSDWESGKPVESIIMGGITPGYERCIQRGVGRLIRVLIDEDIQEEDYLKWIEDQELGRSEPHRIAGKMKIDDLGLSGAQYGAVVNLAFGIYRMGMSAISDEAYKDRKIKIHTKSPPGDFGKQDSTDDPDYQWSEGYGT